ncbi:hypothetical protein Dimus_038347 [Dionaea muscipula]
MGSTDALPLMLTPCPSDLLMPVLTVPVSALILPLKLLAAAGPSPNPVGMRRTISGNPVIQTCCWSLEGLEKFRGGVVNELLSFSKLFKKSRVVQRIIFIAPS